MKVTQASMSTRWDHQGKWRGKPCRKKQFLEGDDRGIELGEMQRRIGAGVSGKVTLATT